eukprot:Awhi_evm1s13349
MSLKIRVLALLILFLTSFTNAEESCEDGILNQNEIDVDCGGVCGICQNCDDGLQNQDETGVDCGGVCDACPTCDDNLQNQNETGIDCGGICEACGGNQIERIMVYENVASITAVNSFISSEIANGRSLIKIEYGRKTEDSYPTNSNPPFPYSYSTANGPCDIVNLDHLLTNDQLPLSIDDHCYGTYKLFYITFGD